MENRADSDEEELITPQLPYIYTTRKKGFMRRSSEKFHIGNKSLPNIKESPRNKRSLSISKTLATRIEPDKKIPQNLNKNPIAVV